MNFNLFQEGNNTFPSFQIKNDENIMSIPSSMEIPFVAPSSAAFDAFNQST
jgi:hypothetical protein